LIVDDEKNIRLTLAQALVALALDTDSAVNGEEALAKIKDKSFGLMLLDLKMPGMDGLEVLRWVSENRPDVRVIIITAHGTIDSAVEAMKYGAVDFIQKPFSPKEIRELVSKVLDRETLTEPQADDYAGRIEMAKKCVAERHFDAAAEHVRKAIAIDSGRPEAFNFLGAIHDLRGEQLEAQKNFRTALSIDPTYEPARRNLYRSTKARPGGTVAFVEEETDVEKGE
ncbi:MAG: response regulator, partial [Sedimentisphaerales bacterium]|nr:response regulator [Sedimentisphaerales bacterium]